MSRMRISISLTVWSLALVIALGTPAISQTPKAGGTLKKSAAGNGLHRQPSLAARSTAAITRT